MRKLTGPVFFCLLAFGIAQRQEAAGGNDAKKELEKLRGTWTLETRISGGKESKQAKALASQLRIDGSNWTVLIRGKALSADRIVLDPSQNPKTIDRISEPGGRKVVVRGVYKLQGDTLTVAVAPAGEARPKSFEAPKGSSTILSIYKRE
jgi:uncharacterized protein (TIGR03067 family)